MTRGCASFLCALWALLACSWAAAHNASNADLLLAGELQEGFIRYLLFPNVLNEPETTWSTVRLWVWGVFFFLTFLFLSVVRDAASRRFGDGRLCGAGQPLPGQFR